MTGVARERDNALDVARGLAMVLVVAGHSIRGLAAAHIGSRVVVGNLDTFLYLGRLPVFAVAVGLLTPAAVERFGPRSYVKRRLSLLLYLFLVWTVIQGVLEVVTSPIKNRPVTWVDVLSIWEPLGHLWFMPHLIVVTLVLVAVAPWRPGPRAVIGTVIVVVVSLLAWGWDPGLIGLGGLSLLAWYLFGAYVGAQRFHDFFERFSSRSLVLVGSALVAVAIAMVLFLPVTVPTTDTNTRTPLTIALGVVASVIEVAGGFALTAVWARSPRWSAWIAYIGRQSLPVYLAHILVTASVRIVLVWLGVRNLWLHILIAVPLAVAFPLLLERVTRRYPYLFVPPWRFRKRRPQPVAA